MAGKSGSATKLQLSGDQMLLLGAGDEMCLWRVIERGDAGWHLDPFLGSEAAFFNDSELTRLRAAGSLKILNANFGALPAERKGLLAKPYELLTDTQKAVVEARKALMLVAKTKWRAGSKINRAIRDAVRELVLDAPEDLDQGTQKGWSSGFYKAQRPPTKSARDWWRWWQAAGEDERILAPLFDLRGNHGWRLPKGEEQKVRAEIKNKYLTREKAHLTTVVERFNEHRDIKISYTAFFNYLHRHWTEREICLLREGSEVAASRYGIWEKIADAEYPLDRVEMDHCLLDVLLKRPRGKPARPWLTTMVDSCTRMVLGCHLTFESPSFQSVRYAFVHGFLPKDLTGSGLKHPWPCEGVPRVIVCDHGAEFACAEMTRAEANLQFKIRQLGGRKPWYKGRVERFFRTMQIKLLDFEKGKTFSSVAKKGTYKPDPTLTIEQIETKLREWIVDKYHVSPHRGLNKRRPLDVWVEKTDQRGLTRPADRDLVMRLLGDIYYLPIGKHGVEYNRRFYYAVDLDIIKRTKPKSSKYACEIDHQDVSYIRFLDDVRGRWLILPVRQDRVLDEVGMAVEDQHFFTPPSLSSDASGQSSPSRKVIDADAARRKVVPEVWEPDDRFNSLLEDEMAILRNI